MKKKVELRVVNPEFPDTIYAVSVDPNSIEDEGYLLVSKTPEGAEPDEGETGNVAVYQLVRVGKLVVTVS